MLMSHVQNLTGWQDERCNEDFKNKDHSRVNNGRQRALLDVNYVNYL